MLNRISMQRRRLSMVMDDEDHMPNKGYSPYLSIPKAIAWNPRKNFYSKTTNRRQMSMGGEYTSYNGRNYGSRLKLPQIGSRNRTGLITLQSSPYLNTPKRIPRRARQNTMMKAKYNRQTASSHSSTWEFDEDNRTGSTKLQGRPYLNTPTSIPSRSRKNSMMKKYEGQTVYLNPSTWKIDEDKRVELWRIGRPTPIGAVGNRSTFAGVIRALEKSSINNVTLYMDAKKIEPTNSKDTLRSMLGYVEYPVKLFVVQSPYRRKPLRRFLTTDRHDVLDGYEADEPCVEMSCGHATNGADDTSTSVEFLSSKTPTTLLASPENLFNYCRVEVDEKHCTFRCPGCGEEWSFIELQSKACLTCDERNLFELKMSEACLEKRSQVYQCPQCKEYIEDVSVPKLFTCVYCERNGNPYRFCKRCKQVLRTSYMRECPNIDCAKNYESIVTKLRTCERKEIAGGKCPSVRACPSLSCSYPSRRGL